MDNYRHHVSSFFAHREEADAALASLLARGLPRERLHVFAADASTPAPVPAGDSNQVLKSVLVDGAIGTAIGTAVGGLGELALVAAGVSLFVASPLIAPLAMLGWGASLGGFIGAVAGASGKKGDTPATREGKFSELVDDAILSGQVVLLADTRTEAETAIAKDVLQAAVGEFEDVAAL